LNQAAAGSPKRSNGADESRRPGTGAEKANQVQVLEPLAIGDVGLPAWHVLNMLCVDQVDFESARFQNPVNRNPVHVSRLYRHRVNSALHEPVGQRMQIARERRMKSGHEEWPDFPSVGVKLRASTYRDSSTCPYWARNARTTSGGAVSGDPLWNGGSGAYSISN
jgi:hypothetical protein